MVVANEFEFPFELELCNQLLKERERKRVRITFVGGDVSQVCLFCYPFFSLARLEAFYIKYQSQSMTFKSTVVCEYPKKKVLLKEVREYLADQVCIEGVIDEATINKAVTLFARFRLTEKMLDIAGDEFTCVAGILNGNIFKGKLLEQCAVLATAISGLDGCS